MTELLSPAGDFETACVALFNGCDAIYCASERFGARAYAKNLTLDELKKLLILAHTINKKIYITVNTIIKDSELEDCIKYVDTLYELGVDGIICADYAIITHIISNLPGMEAHISTQAGVKCLEDVRFFEELGAKRCVLARENTFEEIKAIKNASDMPLEIFAHGALCVSYSGGCLFSSLTTLRSGNRGRCSQNCRREYKLYKNNELFQGTGFHLSMKDLNTSSNLIKMLEIGVDSLKLEGRMKNPEYVKIVTSEYRKAIDNPGYKPKLLETIFHRAYTKGFIFGEDKGEIVDNTKKSNEGEFVGDVISKNKDLTKINLIKAIHVGDRLKLVDKNDEHYFNVDKLLNKDMKNVDSTSGIAYINVFKNINSAKIYKMVDSTIDTTIDNTYKLPITITVSGTYDTPLTISTKVNGKTYKASTTINLSEAMKAPINTDTLIKQFSKLSETAMYLDKVNNFLSGNLFITVGALNEVRRNLVAQIEDDMQHKRILPNYILDNEPINYDKEENKLCVFCVTEDQKKACLDAGVDVIYYDNYIPYVDAKFEDINSKYILAGNYGALWKYKDKEITADYSFNAINSRAVYMLHKAGAKYINISVEASHSTMQDLYNSYVSTYNSNPNLEIMVYGRQNLMTTKYCPLRRYGECGKCKNSNYAIEDNLARFPLYHVGCITHIVNEKPLNLVDDLYEINKFTNRFRINLTIESYEESLRILNMFKYKLLHMDEALKRFNSSTDTRGYYKREIL